MPPAAVRPSSRHRFLVVLATLTVLLSGFFALGRLPIDLLPAHEAPHLLVRVSVPGVSASVIEEKITRRLEQTLTGTAGVTSIESVTTSGGAVIDLPLQHRRDMEAAQQNMTLRLDQAKSFWPASVEPPIRRPSRSRLIWERDISPTIRPRHCVTGSRMSSPESSASCQACPRWTCKAARCAKSW